MSAHTPGPWTASIQRNKAGDDLGWIVEHSNGRIGWASLAYRDANVEATPEDPAREANARLIAAAPDLLTALRVAVRQNAHDLLMTGEELRTCEAAIAKAEGKS